MREVTVETISPPDAYTRPQLQLALKIAFTLDRGRFVLAEPPKRA